jgi:hypothetical protein
MNDRHSKNYILTNMEAFMKFFFATIFVLFLGSIGLAQEEAQSRFEIYGFTMMDAGYDFKQVHPDWFDVLRPTKLASYEDEFGPDGDAYFSVRQTRLGFKSTTQTAMGELFTIFEWELFGTGGDAGQTTIRLRHAYGELGQFGAGQYWSPFMDIEVFPNSVEYWGPNGMAFFRNVQFRWMPIKGDSRLTIALERPGASADRGDYADRIALQNVKTHFPLPDISAEYRHAGSWGYVELAGIVRQMKWEDFEKDSIDLTGDALGWGINLSSNLKIGANDVARIAVVYGEGIQNYMNDAPVDVGIKNNPGNAVKPIEGVALPVLGVTAFLDHNWNKNFSTAIGYSMIDIDNSDGQPASAFKKGQYALVNLMYYPVNNVMLGGELQWGSRENYNDGWDTSDYRIQFSFKYNFSKVFNQN